MYLGVTLVVSVEERFNLNGKALDHGVDYQLEVHRQLKQRAAPIGQVAHFTFGAAVASTGQRHGPAGNELLKVVVGQVNPNS